VSTAGTARPRPVAGTTGQVAPGVGLEGELASGNLRGGDRRSFAVNEHIYHEKRSERVI